jgi:predicted NACHT family NTPase
VSGDLKRWVTDSHRSQNRRPADLQAPGPGEQELVATSPEISGTPQPRALWDFFVQHSLTPNAMESLQENLLQAVTAGRALVIFEGLDEVPTGPQRAFVKRAIEEFAAAAPFKASRVLVTCRSRAYLLPALHLKDIAETDQPEFTAAPLADFDRARILRFTQSWYAELARLDSNLLGAESDRAARLYGAIQSPSLWPHAGRPMLLTVMANVHAKNDKLPHDRAQVYSEMVEILVESWDNVRLEKWAPLRRLLEEARKDKKDLIRFLCELAYEAHTRDHGLEKGRDGLTYPSTAGTACSKSWPSFAAAMIGPKN